MAHLLTGIGVLVRGHSLRRRVKESSERIVEAWKDGGTPLEVDRFQSIVDAGHYSKGLTVRYGCAKSRYKKRCASASPFCDPVLIPSRREREGGDLLEDIELLSAADGAILPPHATFSRWYHGGVPVDNEVGPVFEDCWLRRIPFGQGATASRSVMKNAVEALKGARKRNPSTAVPSCHGRRFNRLNTQI